MDYIGLIFYTLCQQTDQLVRVSLAFYKKSDDIATQANFYHSIQLIITLVELPIYLRIKNYSLK